MDVLLLRGLGRESGHWLDFPQLLETQLGPSSKVYALDNPGVGTESTRHAPCSLPETVDDLLQRFQAARDADLRTGPWLAAGVSLGGMLALEIAGRGVPSCGGVVVANSSCTHLSWSWERLRPMAFFAMLHALAKCDLEEKERIMIPFTIHDQKRQEQSHEARLHIARHRPLPMRTFVAQCIAASSWRPPKACQVPLLVLCSDTDRLVRASCSHAIAEHYGGTLACHPTAGHDITCDAPEWACEQVVKWLATAVASGTPSASAA